MLFNQDFGFRLLVFLDCPKELVQILIWKILINSHEFLDLCPTMKSRRCLKI
jgi:hypothetical protein